MAQAQLKTYITREFRSWGREPAEPQTEPIDPALAKTPQMIPVVAGTRRITIWQRYELMQYLDGQNRLLCSEKETLYQS